MKQAQRDMVQKMSEDVLDVFTKPEYADTSDLEIIGALAFAFTFSASEAGMSLSEYMDFCRSAYQAQQEVREARKGQVSGT